MSERHPGSEAQPASLDQKLARIRAISVELRDGEIDHEQASALIQECAQLASAAGSELEQALRSIENAPTQMP